MADSHYWLQAQGGHEQPEKKLGKKIYSWKSINVMQF